jgi:hypothetical protein
VKRVSCGRHIACGEAEPQPDAGADLDFDQRVGIVSEADEIPVGANSIDQARQHCTQVASDGDVILENQKRAVPGRTIFPEHAMGERGTNRSGLVARCAGHEDVRVDDCQIERAAVDRLEWRCVDTGRLVPGPKLLQPLRGARQRDHAHVKPLCEAG